tara:strand:+ start:14290 stop:15129 length:840 start_codon:yes stop_codon:yes gene_type:complete
MPLPSPNNKEKRKDFMSRCMVDLSKKGEFENPKQRAAVCISQFEKAKEESNASAGEGDTEFLVFTSAAYDYSGKKKEKEKSKSMKKYSSYGSPNPQDHYFEKKEDAEKDAEKMGLKGIHTHKDKDGKTLYMAGPSHEAFMKKHKEILEKKKEKSEAMDKTDMKEVFMSHCAAYDKDLVDTTGMDDKKTYAACAMQYKKMKADMEEEDEKGLTEKQKKLPKPIRDAILKKQAEKSDSSLWENIKKKRDRIKRGSGEKMRKKGDKGAPTSEQMKKAKGDKD